MSWCEVSTLGLRFEFVMLAQQEGCNFSQLCQRFNISRKTGYKWLTRYLDSGKSGLVDRSRRPHSSPLRTEEAVEDLILALREQHPTWGGRKLRVLVVNAGHQGVPAPSTITTILQRGGKIAPDESLKHTAFTSFEHPRPNDLWQMDFKGHFAMQHGRCHPLTVLDDHSRYNVLLKACSNETADTVKQALISAFRRYGLPYRMTMDNGSPWGNDAFNELTVLTVWLIRLGILVSHSRPYHPQTQGKDERFHRTLNEDTIRNQHFEGLEQCQEAFDQFRECYNFVRPHESLGMKTPGTRFEPSQRPYPEALPPIEYSQEDEVRKVQAEGAFSFRGHAFKVSKALRGQLIAIRPTETDGIFSLYFCRQRLKEISLRET